MRRSSLILALSAGLAAFTLWWFTDPLATVAARVGLRFLEREDVRFTRLDLSGGRLAIDDLAIGRPEAPDLMIRRLVLRVGPSGLVRGRIDAADVLGLRLRAAVTDGGLDLGRLGRVSFDRGRGGSTGLPPPDRVRLVRARVDLATPAGRLTLPRLDGNFATDADATRFALKARGGDFIWNATTDAPPARVRFDVDVDGALEGWAPTEAPTPTIGRVSVAVAAEGRIPPGIRVESASLRGAARLRPTSSGTRIDLIGPVRLALGTVRLPGGRTLEPVTLLAPPEPGVPAAVVRSANNDGPPTEARLSVMPAPFRLRLADDTATDVLEGTTPRATLTFEGARGRLRLTGGELRLPGRGLRAGDVGAEVTLDAAVKAVFLSLGQVEHTRRPAWLAPMRLEARLGREAEGWNVIVEVEGIDGPPRLAFVGRLTPDLGGGRGWLRVGSMNFAPGGPRLAVISPRLATLIREPRGRVAAHGEVAFGDERARSALDVIVDDLDFAVGPARVRGLRGVVRLNRLVPPATPPGQVMTANGLEIGPLRLADGLLAFRRHPDGALEASRLRWRLAGGEVKAPPFVVPPDGARVDVALFLERLDLGALLKLLDVDGLSGEGRLYGRLPLVVEDGSTRVVSGGMKAAGPGVLRYRPRAVLGDSDGKDDRENLLRKAFDDFRFDELDVDADGAFDGEMALRLSLGGSNPDLYDGYPMKFTFNIRGNPGAVMRSGWRTGLLNLLVPKDAGRFGR